MKITDKIKYFAEKAPEKKALNRLSRSELWEKIISHPEMKQGRVVYSAVDSMEVVTDILSAELKNKPVVISADLSGAEKFIKTQPSDFFSEFSITLKTSGSTGKSKFIKQPAEMIYSNLLNAVKLQKLTEEDRILTVSSLLHAGGVHVQTLPGLYVGAEIDIHKFSLSAVNVNPYTVTHFIPRQAELLIKAFKRKKVQFKSYRLIVCGSDVVPRAVTDFFTNQVNEFIVNYGMTEAGPVIINHSFKSNKGIDELYSKGAGWHFLGTNCLCDFKIIDNELYLSGKNICSDGFLKTGDRVKQIGDGFYFGGRA